MNDRKKFNAKVEELFESLSETPRILVPSGNLDARVLAIAPPPDPEELGLGRSLAGTRGWEMMLAAKKAEFDPSESWLILPCNLFGKKPLKANTKAVNDLVLEAAQKDLFKTFVMIGKESFSVHCNQGKKATINPFFRHPVKVPLLSYRTVVVLPDLDYCYLGAQYDSLTRKARSSYENHRIQFHSVVKHMANLIR